MGVSKPHVFDKEIFALALPTLGAVLIDPCLSLVDTGYVGRLGALSLAAIGPCAAAFNFVFVTARWAGVKRLFWSRCWTNARKHRGCSWCLLRSP